MNMNPIGSKRRFLIVRHRSYRRFFFVVLLRWVKTNLPDLRHWFEVHDLPVRIHDWSRYVLHAAWLQDPVQRWSMETFEQALLLAHQCDQHRIPIVNRVDRLINATKSRGAQLMREAGVRVPGMALVDNPEEFQETLSGLTLPLFIREDWGHDRNLVRVDTRDQVRQIPWSTFKRPLAVEVVDVRSPVDGLFRKYRYVVAGDVGVSHHLHISRDWITRGEERVLSQKTRDEELEYISHTDPNHETLHRARQALGLDLAAFDYGYAPDGQMVVWEANPFAHFLFARKALKYKNPAMHRTMLAILHLYFSAARLPVPNEVVDGLALDFAGIDRRFQIVRKTNLMDRLLALPKSFPNWPA
jgi:hypothetical protein